MLSRYTSASVDDIAGCFQANCLSEAVLVVNAPSLLFEFDLDEDGLLNNEQELPFASFDASIASIPAANSIEEGFLFILFSEWLRACSLTASTDTNRQTAMLLLVFRLALRFAARTIR
jgi:hypothetical protein